MADDSNTTPLIDTIRETTIAAIYKKYSIEKAHKRFDITHSENETEYIESQIEEYNGDIQDIIDAIPDDPPVPQNPNCYFTNQGAAATSNFTFLGSTNYYMYDASGQLIPYDGSKTYTIIAKYNIDGNLVTGGFADGIKFNNSSGYLCTVRNWSDGPAYIFRIEYTVS